MNPKEFDLKGYLSTKRTLIDRALERWLPYAVGHAAPVKEAMRYSVGAGGKRVRPILILAGGQVVGASDHLLLPAACAMECLHTYSLIHDDLPAMDNDDLRRGKPTCHKIFGEALAILAGDALLTFAFELMTNPELTSEIQPERINRAVFVLARAAGESGMVGGQAADILNEGKTVEAQVLHYIHYHKTAALLGASVEIGAILGGGCEEDIIRLRRYGQALGLAFQIKDDILDIEGDQNVIGKPTGSDARQKKVTYPSLFGIETAKAKALELLNEAISLLEPFNHKAEPLRAIARYVIDRNR